MDRQGLINRIARKHNLSKKEVEEAVDSQFKCVVMVMKKGEGEQVRLPYFGKFDVSEYRKKKVEENSGKGLRKALN